MDEFWMRLLQETALILVNALVPLLAGYLVVQIRKVWLQARLEQPDIFYTVENIARQVVNAAEQAGAAGYIENKKAYALALAEKWLEEKGIVVDLELIDAAIEAAVLTEINKQQWPPAPEAAE